MTFDLDVEINARIQGEVAGRVASALSGVLKGDPGEPGPPGAGSAFGGRLTLTSGAPVMTSDQIAKQQLFYAPFCGDSLPIVVSGALTPKPFLSGPTDQVGLALDMAGNSAWSVGTVHDVFAVWSGTQLVLATRQWDAAMFPTEELITGGTTITGGSSWANPDAAFDDNLDQAWSSSARLYPAAAGMSNFLGRDFVAPEAVSRVSLKASNNNMLVNSGTTAAVTKVWGSDNGTNWNMLGYFYADCSANANVNSFPINVSNRVPYDKIRVGIDPGGSNYSINIAELDFFREVPPVSRRLTRFAGLLVNDASMVVRVGVSETIAVDAGAGMYLGTIRIDPDAGGRVTAHASYGPARMFNVWNAYNRRSVTLRAGVITPDASSYSLSQGWGPIQSGGYNIDVLQGLAEEPVSASLHRSVFLNGQCAYGCGIAVDNTNSFSGKEASLNFDNTGTQSGSHMEARLSMPLFAGVRKLHGIEWGRGPGTVSPSVDQRSAVLEASWLG